MCEGLVDPHDTDNLMLGQGCYEYNENKTSNGHLVLHIQLGAVHRTNVCQALTVL